MQQKSKCRLCVLYTHDNHNDIKNNGTTNTYSYTAKYKYRPTLLFRYERFIINSLTSVLRHEKRKTILTMLTIPHAQRILWCFKISVGRDPKNSTLRLNGRIPNTRLNGRNLTSLSFHGPISTPNWFFFKILKFTEPSLPGMTSSTLPTHFLSGGLLWQWYYLPTPLLGQDMTQGQFLSGV